MYLKKFNNTRVKIVMRRFRYHLIFYDFNYFFRHLSGGIDDILYAFFIFKSNNNCSFYLSVRSRLKQ